MDEQTTAANVRNVEEPRGTFGFERKVQVRDYESAVASIHVQFPINPLDEQETVQNIKDAAFLAKSAVFDQLGIKFEYDQESGIVNELLTKTFGPVVEVQSAPAAAAPAAPRQAPPSDGGVACPKCNGAMYDNRNSKTNPRQPDFRCKNYKANPPCDGVVWPPKGGK